MSTMKVCPNPRCRTPNDPSEQYCISCGDELGMQMGSETRTDPVGVPPTELATAPPPRPRPQEAPGGSNRGGGKKTILVDSSESDEIQVYRLGSEMRRQGAPYSFRDREEGYVIGREKGHILIQTDAMVSKEHARVSVSNMQAMVEDLNSRNGVFLRLRKDDIHELQDGDAILLGSEFLVFRNPRGTKPTQNAEPAPAAAPAGPGTRDIDVFDDLDAAAKSGSSGRTPTAIEIGTVFSQKSARPAKPAPAQPVRSPASAGGKTAFKTEFLEDGSEGPQAFLDRYNHGTVTAALYLFVPRISLGREGCTFNFPANKVSRQHAEIYAEDGKFLLRDLGSSNGTFVRIRGSCELRHGDQFRVGNACFELDAPKFGG